MNARFRACLELIRPPNLFTAAGDALGGFFFAGGLFVEWPTAATLCFASMCLYAGGVALNDVLDAARDAIERPNRPIPSRRITRAAAIRLSVLLLAIGVLLAGAVSTRSAAIAAGIVAAVVLYNGVLKQTPLAPAVMGICRALNLALGLFALPGLSIHRAARPFALMWLYVASVTLFARKEAGGGGRVRLALGAAGICTAVLGLWSLRWSGYDARHGEFVMLVVAMLAMIVSVSWKAWACPNPDRIQASVKWYVLFLILFDACLAWVTGGPFAAMLVASLLLPALLLSRVFRVT